ncbi:TIGR02171 family protein [Fibrobacter sp. UWEL]|uniref:TIGR02171 family lipoprotein n=1 Tax=Fibrobacter sp. UWEL TaxID=1896209 RepID=UPI00091A1328|nr:TIGR02171 family protein [Fibrobacter sp. UWEL]SHL04277.1 TIGR02171 family protein [Fibrobacter sp. UWEL]
MMGKFAKYAGALGLAAFTVSCTHHDANPMYQDDYDVSEVEYGKDEAHEGLIHIQSAGHYTYVGTNKVNANKKEMPAMKVKFDYDFSIGEHEVTQAEYASVMGGEPAPGCENLPIANVTFGDMVMYANNRSKLEGYDTVYTFTAVDYDSLHHVNGFENFVFNPEVDGYRLPTEAEWIFAASHGWDVSDGWNLTNSGEQAHDVCSKARNNLGICDMAGNLAEWVSDWLGYFKDTTVTNFVGAPDGGSLGERVLKGGSFKHSVARTNLHSRLDTYTVISKNRDNYVGGRIAFGKIEKPVWMAADGSTSSSIMKSLVKASTLKKKLGTLRAKMAFVNRLTDNLVYMNFNESSFTVKEIKDSLGIKVRHPDISPDGEWVAFSTGGEGISGKSELYVRRLNLAGTDLVKLDVESAAIPRFQVTDAGDTVIVYVTTADVNTDSEFFKTTSTWQVPFSGGKFGTPEKLFDGNYHGGVSPDGKLAVTGARILRARIQHEESYTDTVWFDSVQACNASLSQDGTKRTLFLDFAKRNGPGREFVGKDYGVHERMFVADSTGNLLQSVGAPGDLAFDHTEWINGKNLAVASVYDVNGSHTKLVLIDLQDSSVTDLVKGDELWDPCLRVLNVNLPEDEKFLNLDSAGVYMTATSDITTRIMKIKMEYFWQYREVTEVAVIGSSRSFSGLDPTAVTSHFTINLAYSAEDLTATNFFVSNYILPLMPKLKAVVITLDYDRWFVKDENWKAWFGDIPGYRYDENHDFWKDGVPKSMLNLTRSAMTPDDEESYTFGYNNGLYHSESEGWVDENPEVSWDVNWYRNNPDAYAYNREKLVAILKAAKEKGILVIGAVFPQSPYYVKKNVWGRYGLTLDHTKEIQDDMKSLQEEYGNFIIFDEYKDGVNDYVYEDFSNEDHLGLQGAVKVAERLDSLLMKELDP